MYFSLAGFSKGVSATGPKNGEFTMQLGLRRTVRTLKLWVQLSLDAGPSTSRPAQSDSLGKGQEAAEEEGDDLEAGHWS